jgi:hypothetical protein
VALDRSIGLAIALLATPALTPLSTAHNPADTLNAPVEYGDDLLVVGDEGTLSVLDTDGQPLERGNLSGLGEVRDGPAVVDGTASLVRQVYPDQRPQAVGVDGTEQTWTIPLGERGDRAWITAREDRFVAFTQTSHLLEISPSGEILANHSLPSQPVAEPAPAPDGDWWIPTRDAIERVGPSGELAETSRYTGVATDVTAADEHVLVSLTHRGDRRGTLMAFEHDLDLDWSRGLSGLRLGGSPATLDDAYAVGTYDPNGARLVWLAAENGSIQREHGSVNATAAAPAAVSGGLAVATTERLAGLTAEGNRTWTVDVAPLLASPEEVAGYVTVAGGENRVPAVHPNGTLAWTYSDGVTSPPWDDHHGGAGSSESSATTGGDESQDGVPLPRPVAIAALAGAAIAARARAA